MQETLEMQPNKAYRDNPLGGILFYEFKFLVSWPGHAMILLAILIIQPLPPIPMAPQSVQKGGGWVQRFVAVVHQHSVRQETKMARSGTLLSYLAQREIQSCCFSHYGTMGLLSPFVVLCTCWHRYLVLWYWALFTNKWSKLNGRKWLPWLVHVIVQTFPAFKMNNIIILVKSDKLMPYGEQRLQWINAGWENHYPLKRLS